ncbi:DUF6010 family protein [Zavarzinia compransoris]|uniref:Uncharacterized protein n=1 Tax=Zavarzinia compransoris TaxID=1264899 RepID=A0A317DWT2_9PROT|nr:DUF6010 family protein [Zavarzinia compransoris]PWR18814.1 hypothetical protein DKG75_17695 [Zavarzinia compransoris]TDP48801.1 hypothetical protein DES42_101159 [Zavarzinia compransoris]
MTATAIDKHHHHQGVLAPALVGIGLSVLTVPAHLFLPRDASIDLAAVTVAVIGAIYLGFAIQAGSVRQIAVEAVVAVLFLGAALAGLWWSPWVVPAAYAGHGVWDWLHHGRGHSRDLVAVKSWYPPFCAAYDWIFALGLAAIWLL